MTLFSPPRLHQKMIYWFCRNLTRVLLSLFWRLEIKGTENIPPAGGVLLASNHISNVDPPLVGSSAPRPLYYFAKEELFEVPFLGWLIRQTNAFPVKRYEHDVGAFKQAQRLLENGQAVLLFPEGTRSRDGKMGKARPGVGMLAAKTGVPVVPVCVLHSNELARFRKIKVVFGRPMTIPQSQDNKDEYQRFSSSVLETIAELKSNVV